MKFSIFILFAFFKSFPYTFPLHNDKIELALLLDDSHNLKPDEFNAALEVVRQTADAFFQHDGPDSKIALALYGSTVDVKMNLTDDAQAFNGAIEKISPRGGKSAFLGRALRAIRREIFDRQNSSTLRILIVIGGGEIVDAKMAAAEAEQLHKRGVQLFAVQMGNGTAFADLIQDQRIFTPDQIMGLMASIFAPSTSQTPTTRNYTAPTSSESDAASESSTVQQMYPDASTNFHMLPTETDDFSSTAETTTYEESDNSTTTDSMEDPAAGESDEEEQTDPSAYEDDTSAPEDSAEAAEVENRKVETLQKKQTRPTISLLSTRKEGFFITVKKQKALSTQSAPKREVQLVQNDQNDAQMAGTKSTVKPEKKEDNTPIWIICLVVLAMLISVAALIITVASRIRFHRRRQQKKLGSPSQKRSDGEVVETTETAQNDSKEASISVSI